MTYSIRGYSAASLFVTANKQVNGAKTLLSVLATIMFNDFFSLLPQKWKKNWFVLYPASQNGIARLEFFDAPGGGGGGGGGSVGGSNEKTRKLDKKIIRLSECISILPALTESCPKDNMAAFCVETNDKMHVFSAEKAVAKDWMDTMCDIAFQVFFIVFKDLYTC